MCIWRLASIALWLKESVSALQLFTEIVTTGFSLCSPANLKVSVVQVVSHRGLAAAVSFESEQLAKSKDNVIIENINLIRIILKLTNVIDRIHITSEEKLSHVLFPAQIQKLYAAAQEQAETFFD
jgi:hypothetical protein